MNRRAFLTSSLTLPAGLSLVNIAYCQSNVTKPNLMDIVVGKGWQVFNRNVSVINQGKRKIARFDERPLEGLAWMKDLIFANGTIEFELRGKNLFQRSFVGTAFHGLDEKTYDAVYFRPFNFKSEDPVRRQARCSIHLASGLHLEKVARRVSRKIWKGGKASARPGGLVSRASCYQLAASERLC